MKKRGIRQCVCKYFISALSLQQKPLLIYWGLLNSGRRGAGGQRRRIQKRAKNDKNIFALSIHLCGRVSFTLKGTNLEILYPYILRVNEILCCDYLNQTSWVVLSLGSSKYFAEFWLRPLVSVRSTTAFSIRFIDICVKLCVCKVCVCKGRSISLA